MRQSSERDRVYKEFGVILPQEVLKIPLNYRMRKYIHRK